MQDSYVGDIGDFGKYGLLRSLCRADEYGPKLRLGVLWYHFDGNAAGGSDGSLIQYLGSAPGQQERSLRYCDLDLFDKLRDIVCNGRTIEEVEAKGVLPRETLFFSEGLNFDQTPQKEAQIKRRKWLAAGLSAIESAKIVFYDPDNGLEIPSCGRTDPKGPKYVFYDELKPSWERGQSLVIYQHLNHAEDAEDQAAARCQDLCKYLNGSKPIVLRFRRRSSRFFFLLPQRSHEDILKNRVRAFLDSPWSCGRPPHFQEVEVPGAIGIPQ